MKKIPVLYVALLLAFPAFAQNEIGPEGGKLIWIILPVALLIIGFIIARNKGNKGKSKKEPFVLFPKKLLVLLEKDALYYPDNLTLTVKNTSNSDVDLDRPLLIFDNFWLKRKFKLKGVGNRQFYPLYLEKGKSHKLKIDLDGFYSHDKSLKKFPKAKVIVNNVKGKNLGSKSVFLRKTLFKF